MNQEVKAWSFLVSANLYLDYRTIVAPDFMCDAKVTNLLARNAGGDLTPKKILNVTDDKVGKLTLLFRVREAISEDIGIEGNEVIKDSFGREITLIEGFVFKDLLSDIDVSEDKFNEIHNHLKNHYRDFWEWIIPKPAIPSKDFILNCDLKYLKNEENIANNNEKLSLSNQPQAQIQKNQLWKSIKTKEFAAEVTSIAFFPNQDLLAIRIEENQTVILCNLDLKENSHWPGVDIMFGENPTPIAISSDGKYLASARIENLDQNVIKFWNTETRDEKSLWNSNITKLSQLGRISSVAFSSDSLILLSASRKNIEFWDLQSEVRLKEVLKHSGLIKAIAVSPKDNIFGSADSKGTIIIWEFNSTSTSATKKAIINNSHGTPNESPVNSLAFSPDGKILASAGDDYQIRLWNPYTGEKNYDIGQHSTSVNILTFSYDGNFLASGDDDGYIGIWDIKTKQLTAVLEEHKKAVTSLSFSPDGKTLASGSKDHTIRLWQYA